MMHCRGEDPQKDSTFYGAAYPSLQGFRRSGTGHLRLSLPLPRTARSTFDGGKIDIGLWFAVQKTVRPLVLPNEFSLPEPLLGARAKMNGVYAGKGRPASIDASRVRAMNADGLAAAQIAKALGTDGRSGCRAAITALPDGKTVNAAPASTAF